MDIGQWLRETSLPPQEECIPQEPNLTQVFSGGNNKRQRPVEPSGACKRRRSAESSLIEPAFLSRVRNKTDREAVLHTERDESKIASTEPTRSGQSSSETSQPPVAVNDYQRKPRRKTRPDLYDPGVPKARQRAQRKEQARDEEHKDRKDQKRKSNRARMSKPAAGLVLGFQAKNVPKERLTPQLMPAAVPDLVFSEMRFLSKKPEPKSEPTAERKPKPSRKRTSKEADQDEISAFFAPKRRALAEKDRNTEAETRKLSQAGLGRADYGGKSLRKKSASQAAVHPSIELPERAFLGFGSRGARPATAASYHTWAATSDQASVDCPINTDSGSVHKLRSATPLQPTRMQSPTRERRNSRTKEYAGPSFRWPKGQLRFPREMTTIDVGKLVVPAAGTAFQAHTVRNPHRKESHSCAVAQYEDPGLIGARDLPVPDVEGPLDAQQWSKDEKQVHESSPRRKEQREDFNSPAVSQKESSPLTKLLKTCATTLDVSSVRPSEHQLDQRSHYQEQLPLSARNPEELSTGRMAYVGPSYHHDPPALDPRFEIYVEEQLPTACEHGVTAELHPTDALENMYWEDEMTQDENAYAMAEGHGGAETEQLGQGGEYLVLRGPVEQVEDRHYGDSAAYEEGEATGCRGIFAGFWRPNKLY